MKRPVMEDARDRHEHAFRNALNAAVLAARAQHCALEDGNLEQARENLARLESALQRLLLLADDGLSGH